MSQFCLRWNNHQPNFISVFTTLLNTESLVDVTLAAEGKHLQAHKVVLSACSIYFQTLFTMNPSRHPIVIIKDVSYADLRVLVDFMYYGEVNVTEDQLPRILDTARLLKIKGLTEMPDSTKHGSPPAEPVSPERRTKDAEVTTEWEQVTSPPCRSPSAKRKRRKNSDEASVQTQDLKEACVLSDIAAQTEPARSSLVAGLPQQNGMYQLPDITGVYANVLQNRTQETEDNNIRQQQNPYIETNAYAHQGMPWVNSGYVHSSETFPDRQEATATFPGVGGGGGGGGSGGGGEYSEAVPPANGPHEIFTIIPTGDVSQRQQETPNKRRRTNNPQAAENFQRAIEAVRFGGIGFCKAARIFGVNNRTLWLEYKKKGYPNTRPSIRERIKREPTETPDRPEPSPVDPTPAPVNPAPYVVGQNCFQFLQDGSLHSF